jgi:hypothetical protein
MGRPTIWFFQMSSTWTVGRFLSHFQGIRRTAEQLARTFYPGDDPYWTAVDLHYWPTADLEWYDPSAVSTRDGNLVITMTQEPINGLTFK